MDTVMFCEADVNPPGPVHEYVTPEVVEDPFMVTLDVEQESCPETETLAFGGVFRKTVTLAVPVQPLTGSVAVTV